jgi:pimeloyl-ACP methyl ester carboxylesterase
MSLQLSNRNEAVVILHGLASQRVVMSLLASRLQPHVGKLVNWGYPSLFSPIERHASQLNGLLGELDADPQIDTIHVVGHSLGGIIARAALAAQTPKKFGRLVMLAPPNQGSHVASFFSWLGRISPPIGQLTQKPESFVCSLPKLDGLSVGVIAASTDFLVPPGSTRLGTEADHITLRAFHSSLCWQADTAAQVVHFLRNGRFDAKARSAA